MQCAFPGGANNKHHFSNIFEVFETSAPQVLVSSGEQPTAVAEIQMVAVWWSTCEKMRHAFP